ncbi:hypothetical protein EVAR_39231_1 [Eumeta japonica]|uniref:Uncharacterized protein n=1 Tax=Eumeta variegata TaxID=151549 RepID=A0A4C1VNL4_EUMVA|nr:hypothetical protein EVAR_39231_1 [Eumeta japonica]
MQRSSLSIISTKILPAESTPPQPQRVDIMIVEVIKHNAIAVGPCPRRSETTPPFFMSTEEHGIAVSIKSVASQADETRHSNMIDRFQQCLRHGSNAKVFRSERSLNKEDKRSIIMLGSVTLDRA